MRLPGWLFTTTIVALVCGFGCKHDDGAAVGTATIHSGTPEGPRVTDAPVPESAWPELGPTAIRNEYGDALARAYCTHDRACGLGDAETLLLAEEACFSDARSGMRASIDLWPCRPSSARQGLDTCLAAIRDADCSARSGEGARIRACAATEICRRSNLDAP